MKSIFEQANYRELAERMEKLTPSSKQLWGKMDVGQMLHHLNLAMEVPLGKTVVGEKPKFFMRMFRGVLYSAKPFGKGDPTPRSFKVTDSFDFLKEKQAAVANLQEIYDRGAGSEYRPHAFFGELTTEQWGLHFYKHTDHHLSQFGV